MVQSGSHLHQRQPCAPSILLSEAVVIDRTGQRSKRGQWNILRNGTSGIAPRGETRAVAQIRHCEFVLAA
jgi:hypothetical protein